MISVIVPAYNAEKWLDRLIRSVQSQTYNNWECILVNDGSTDKTGDICDSYVASDSRFRVIHQTNGGPNAARNHGIEAARGEFLVFPDADDEFFSEDTFESNLQFLLDDSEIGIVTMPQYREQPDGSFTTKPGQFERRVLTDKREMFTNWYNGQIIDGAFHGKIFRKTLFNGWELIEEIRFTEDHYNIPDLCERCRKIQVSAVGGYVYKYNQESTIHTTLTDFNRYGLLRSEVRLCQYFNKLGNCGSHEAPIYLCAIENAYYLQGTKYEYSAIRNITQLPLHYCQHGTRFQRLLKYVILLFGYKNGLKFVKLCLHTLKAIRNK